MQQQQQNMGQNQQQMQNMGQTQKPMQQQDSEPPQVITTKDLLYITDMMSWNLMALKKAHFYESQCQVPQISQAMQQACQMHERHYQTILNHLANANQQPQQSNQQQQQNQ